MLPTIQDILKPRPRKYRNIAKHLSPLILAADDYTEPLSDTDLFTDLTTSRGTARLLGIYSKRGIKFALQSFGLFEFLEKEGLSGGEIYLDTSDAYKHTLRIIHQINEKSLFSIELVIRYGSFIFPFLEPLKLGNSALDLVVIEWLLLQNPTKNFIRLRPQLPGQEFPGLGSSQLAFEILYWVSRRMKADGVLIVPNYLHTGLFYGRQCLFIDPKKQGLLYSLGKLTDKKYRLDQLTWACAEGQLIDRKQAKKFLWQPTPMVLPVSKRLKDYFFTPTYTQVVREYKTKFQLEINPGYRKTYNSNWKAI